MKLHTSKQLKRIENRKKKIVAFLEVAKLNDQDKEIKKKMNSHEKNDGMQHDGYTDRKADEPCPKRQKTNDGTSSSQSCGRENRKPSHSVEDTKLNGEEKKLPPLAEQDLAELRKQLKERYNTIKKMPIFRLKDSGETASLVTPVDRRVPLFFADIQHLLTFGLLVKDSPHLPSRWCHFSRSGNVSALSIMFIEGINIRDYVHFSEELDALSSSNFQHRVEVVMPSAYGGSLVEELVAIPLSVKQQTNLLNAYGTLETASKESAEVFRVLRAIFPIHYNTKSTETPKAIQKPESGSRIQLPHSDKFSRTHLLLSAWQMIEENYPMPMNNTLREKYSSFVRTMDMYTEVTPFSPMYGLDCEMCITSTGQSELARISIVNEKFEEVLDTLVLPYNKITNYVTHFSGITKELMKGVTTRIEDVQKFIRENLEPDAILVGQSLNFDLVALKMMHPYCIDTSVIFNISGDRYRKSKLRDLARQFLHETIQTNSKGHCSVEDSSACLRLVQLKLQKGIEFGDAVLSSAYLKPDETKGSSQSTGNKHNKNSKQSEAASGYATSLFSYAARGNKKLTIVGKASIIEEYVDYLNPSTTSFEQTDEPPSGTKPVSCVISSSNDNTVEEAVKRSSNNYNTIAHIRLSDQEKENLTQGKADEVKRANEWIKKMYDVTPQHGMCIVVLCGRDTSSNGACFVHLRTSEIKDFHFEPKISLDSPSVTS